MIAVDLLLLGVAQDAGVPQMCCSCANCSLARQGGMPQQYAASAALIDHANRSCWLLDCSPDIKQQYELLQARADGYTLEGVLLTHLHMGHYLGLAQFGREAMDRKGLKVYGTASVCAALRDNKPWSTYVAAGNFQLHELPDSPLSLSAGITVTPVPVPHRAEFSDCVAYIIKGPHKRVLYCPDIDSWDALEQQSGTSIEKLVASVDLAFLDATFYDYSELPASRDPREIPHPLMIDSMKRLAAVAERVVFIHLNHTNPTWNADSPQHASVQQGRYRLGQQGCLYPL